MHTFIVDHVDDECYIMTFLITFFYDDEERQLLKKELSNGPGGLSIYLQEYVKNNILDMVKSDKSIVKCCVKNICSKMGFKGDGLRGFYSFIVEHFQMDRLMIGEKEFDIIDTQCDCDTTIKKLLYEWQKGGNYLSNKPKYIGIGINRKGVRSVDIQKKIKPLNDECVKMVDGWHFYLVICKKKSHYYSIFVHDGVWIQYDDCHVPCMQKVEMNNREFVDMIKKECVFVVYKK